MDVLIDIDEIDRINTDLAERITCDYAGSDHPLLVIVTLKGAAVFAADLLRKIDLPLEVTYMKVASYGSGTVSGGDVRIDFIDGEYDYRQYEILIIDDIVDSGNTLRELREIFLKKHVKSVEFCVMLDKYERRTTEIDIKYTGRRIKDAFTVGYGMDYAEKFRNLPYIAVIKSPGVSE